MKKRVQAGKNWRRKVLAVINGKSVEDCGESRNVGGLNSDA